MESYFNNLPQNINMITAVWGPPIWFFFTFYGYGLS